MTVLAALAPLPAGLTVAGVARIAAAIDAGRATATRAVSACAWRVWTRWCTTRDIPPTPASHRTRFAPT